MKSILEIEIVGTLSHGSYTVIPFPVPMMARYDSGTIMIGSRPPETPSLTIKDGSISRRHCTLSLLEDGWYLQDLGSDNATWIFEDDKPVRLPAWENIKLTAETRILVGYTVLELRIIEGK